MAQLLTDDEVQSITGYERSKEQIRVLRNNGVRFIERGDGKPAVTWEMVNSVGITNTPTIDEDGFNLDGL